MCYHITYRQLRGVVLDGRIWGEEEIASTRGGKHVSVFPFSSISGCTRGLPVFKDAIDGRKYGICPTSASGFVFDDGERSPFHLPIQNDVIISSRTSSRSIDPVTWPRSSRAIRSSSAASSNP